MANLATIDQNILADSGIDPLTFITGTGVAGQVTYWSGTTGITGSNNLFWDATNNRLGIGTNVPSRALVVIGDAIFQSTGTGDGTIAIRVNNSVGTQVLAVGAAGGIIMNTSSKISTVVSPTSIQAQLELYNGGTGNATLQSTSSYGLLLNPNGGNVVIGSTTNGTQRLQVTGDTLLKGSGNTNATVALTINDSANANMLRVRNDGLLRIGNFSGLGIAIFPYTTVTSAPNVNGMNLSIFTYETIGETLEGVVNISGSAFSGISGTQFAFVSSKPFFPTSGTANYANLVSNPIINQTGGANGITRGLYIKPILTSAADWRSIEWTNNTGWGIYGSGTANNYLAGSLGIGTTTLTDGALSPYKTVITGISSGVAGGGLFVTNNTNVVALNAFFASMNFEVTDGTNTKPSGHFFSRVPLSHPNRANPRGNLISNLQVAADNLSITNNNFHINHTDRNSTSNDYVNAQAYLYVQRNSGTVNVNSYTGFLSRYQTALGSETIGTIADFQASTGSLSASSLVTTRYGLLIDFTNTQVTNAWGIYQTSATVKNYLNGNLLIGSATDTGGGQKLQVTGNALITGASTAASFIPSGASVPTNGMYLNATNSLAFSTNSTFRVVIGSTGTLGIGIANPSLGYGDGVGVELSPLGYIQSYRSQGVSATFGRHTTTGLIQTFFYGATAFPATSIGAIGTDGDGLTFSGGAFGATHFTLASTGAATFSSSLQAASATITGDTTFNGTVIGTIASGLTASKILFTQTVANQNAGVAIPILTYQNVSASQGVTMYGIWNSTNQTNFVFQHSQGTTGISMTFNRPANQTVSGNTMILNQEVTPTSGTSTWTQLLVNPTVNQTGGANGISRGLAITPTLTSAADWRSIEWANNTGWGLYGAGTANNYLAGSLGIGTTGLSNTNLNITKNITGNVNCYGVFNSGSIRSDVTTGAQMFTSAPSIQNAVFTLAGLKHFEAVGISSVGSATISSQFGFFVESTMTGGTNNYGFYGNIAAATGRWNLFMDGTANNFMRGSLGIGITTGLTTYALNVNGAIQTSSYIMTPAVYSNTSLQFGISGGTSAMNITTNRNVQIYDSTIPGDGGQRLQVYGRTLITAGALGSTQNALAITATLDSTVATQLGTTIYITGAGSGANTNRALDVSLNAGYTGTQTSFGINGRNASAGLGANSISSSGFGNFGISGEANGTTASGHNAGGIFTASRSAILNSGIIGRAINSTNSAALNIAVAGIALSATNNVGGYFGLTAVEPTITSSSALIANNGTTTSNIFQAQDNGVIVFSIADGGASIFSSSVTANSFVKSSGTAAEILAADGTVITAGTNITISGGVISSTGGGVTGSGTTNTLTKWTSGTAIGNSAITEDGTNVTLLSRTLVIEGSNTSSAIVIQNKSVSPNKLWDISPNGNDLNINESAVAPAIILKAGGGNNVRLYSYTTNGFLKTSSSDGTLIVDSTSYLPLTSGTLSAKLLIDGTEGNPAVSGTSQPGFLRGFGGGGNFVLDFGNSIGNGTAAQYTSWIQSTDKTNLATNYKISLNPNGGFVGIGKLNPQVALDVVGAATFSSSVTATSFDGTTQNIFSVAGTEGMRLTATNRNLHIGAFTSDSGERLQVNGDAKITGDLTLAGTVTTAVNGDYSANFIKTFAQASAISNTNLYGLVSRAEFDLTSGAYSGSETFNATGLFAQAIVAGNTATQSTQPIRAAMASLVGRLGLAAMNLADFRHFDVKAPDDGGVTGHIITNIYGLRIATMKGSSNYTITNGWGIYQEGTTDNNYFAGKVLVGTATPGASPVRLSGLPTSATGLSAGDVWNNAGTLRIV